MEETAEGKAFDYKSMNIETLWIHFYVYGAHAAAVEICDRAVAGDKEASVYANKIWRCRCGCTAKEPASAGAPSQDGNVIEKCTFESE